MKSLMGEPKKKQLDFVFLIPFWGSIVVSVGLSIYIIINNNLALCFSLECINGFYAIFDLPIKIVSAGMALGAFRILVVRSKQSQKQIDLAISQNYFRNYIDHKTEFYEELERFEKKHNVTISDKYILYKELFPNNSPLFFELSIKSGESDLLETLVEIYTNMINELKNVFPKNTTKKDVDKTMFISWLRTYIEVQRLLQLSPKEKLYLKSSDASIVKSDQIPKDIPSVIASISELIELMAVFSMAYKDKGYIVNSHDIRAERLNEEVLKVATTEPQGY